MSEQQKTDQKECLPAGKKSVRPKTAPSPSTNKVKGNSKVVKKQEVVKAESAINKGGQPPLKRKLAEICQREDLPLIIGGAKRLKGGKPKVRCLRDRIIVKITKLPEAYK